MCDEILKTLGQKVKYFRKKAHFTQEVLAEKVNVHPTYIGKIELGKNNPSYLLLYKIIQALNIDFKTFFNDLG